MSTNKIGFNNFKAFGEKMQTFPKKPITLVYGPNSIGKSSLLHSQLYFEYIKENSKFDLFSTKFAGDELDFNGFDNFIHKKDTKNSISFETIITNQEDIINFLAMFNKGLNKSEIESLVSYFRVKGKPKLFLKKIDKTTYQHYSILNTIERIQKLKISQKELDLLLIDNSLNNYHNSLEFIDNLINMQEELKLIIKNTQLYLIRNFETFTINKNFEYVHEFINEHGINIKDFKNKMPIDEDLRKIKNETDEVIKNRMLELYIEKWLSENIDSIKVDDNELLIYKLMYSNVISLKESEKEKIEQNLFYEIDFLNYINNIQNIKIKLDINKQSTKEVIFNITIYIDDVELFRTVYKGQKHEIIINNKNGLLVKFSEKLDSFVEIVDLEQVLSTMKESNMFSKHDIEEYQSIKSRKPNPMNEHKNFFMTLSWSKKEKIIFNKLNNLSNDISIDSLSLWSPVEIFNSSLILFRPLVLNTVLSVVNNEKIEGCQYFGPLRFYPTRTGHLIKRELNENENLNGENIWEYIKNSQELQDSLNQILLNKDIFNTTYQVEIQNKFNLIGSQIKSLNFENKTNEEIIQRLMDIAKVENELIFLDKQKNTPVNLRDMGLGNSQMIPFLLLCNHEVNTRFFIEQPELHLHPKIQAELADEFIQSYKKRDNEFMIETHSEHLLLRIMKRMRHTAEDKRDRDKSLDLTPDDICLLYIDANNDSAYIKELRLSKKGKLLDHWPGGFFEEGYQERFQ